MHPALLAGIFKALEYVGLDGPWVEYAPRLLHGVLAALGDYFTMRFAERVFGAAAARWTLLCCMSSWFLFYCMVRSFSNSIEALLLVAVLSLWPSSEEIAQSARETMRRWCICAVLFGVGVAVRPTSAILWGFLCLPQLHRVRFLPALLLAGTVLLLGIAFDSLVRGERVVALFNFALYNIVVNVGEWYGTHAWHWYFTQGWPVVLLSTAPLALAGVVQTARTHRAPIALVAFGTLVYSALAHKEFRFLLPLLYPMLCYAGAFMAKLSAECEVKQQQQKRAATRKLNIALVLLALNVLPACYFSLFHQRAPIDVMEHIARDPRVSVVDFLVPCHSTPLYSIVHRRIEMRTLDCSPLQHIARVHEYRGERVDSEHAPAWIDANEWQRAIELGSNYVDQSDRFKHDPLQVLEEYYALHELPSHVVVFSSMQPRIDEFLREANMQLCASFTHDYFSGESLLLYCVDDWRDTRSAVDDAHAVLRSISAEAMKQLSE